MKITKKHIAEVIKNGNWIIRADDNGKSVSSDAHGFRWQPLGVWTVAPDWNEKAECGGGLHGQDKDHGGTIMGTRLVFCETRGPHIAIDGEKVKVREARILMINALPDGLTVGGWLDLAGCTGITALPDGLTVGGSLDLRGTGITALPENIHSMVKGNIYGGAA